MNFAWTKLTCNEIYKAKVFMNSFYLSMKLR